MKHSLKIVSLAASLAVAPAFAEVKINDQLSVSGFMAAAYEFVDNNNNVADVNSKVDARTPGIGSNADMGKVGVAFKQDDFGAFASLAYFPRLADEAGVLDAYVTYTVEGFTFTGGKFLSWLGYEAFDTVNMTQLTYANSTLGAIPGYHTGVKFDYSNDTFGGGLAVTDSYSHEQGFFRGDEDFEDVAFEGYVVYKGIEKLTLWAGFAYEDTERKGLVITQATSVYDIWASYAVTDKLTVAAEFAMKESDALVGADGYQWLAFTQYAFTKEFSLVGRISGDDTETGDENRYTVAPTYVFTDNFSVKAEFSIVDKNAGVNDSTYYGVQGVFKF